jgi:hypothetical protein
MKGFVAKQTSVGEDGNVAGKKLAFLFPYAKQENE